MASQVDEGGAVALALTIITLDVFVIWAIANARTPRERELEMMMGSQAGYGAGGYGGSYAADQSGQRWPENVRERDQVSGRHSAQDMKERAGQYGDQTQDQGRLTAEEAEQRARESGRGFRR